ncbi:MAG: bifunctional 4-hydroxy-2-oxoglutarate aldolase/2-dehydro-3-deoxy-phosphogluconate aldolase [Chloroflexota bacterium]
MARFMRLDVTNTLLDTGVLPLFYNGDTESAIELVSACVRAGVRTIEFTNRGEMAYPVFTELVRHFVKADPSVILGIGSIIDAPTAALFLAVGANFIVGPSFNPEISRLCNRRKVLYLPGCSTENEIVTAEELGAEICKIFPGESAGGPGFISAVMAPCPWHRLLPTGGVDATQASISEWIKAGAAAVGLGSKLISAQAVKDKDYDGITAKTAQCVDWVQSARGGSVFSGVEHIGLYANKSSPEALSAWYEQTFDFKRKEGNSSFFVSGVGAGRVEFPKTSAEVPVHLAVRVTNFEAAQEALHAKGISLKDVNIKSDVKSGYLDISDPEGNLVHLLWLPKK